MLNSRDSVRDEVRKAEVIAHAVKVADDRGFPPRLAYRLYDMLVDPAGLEIIRDEA